MLGLPNERQYLGRGVSNCATCDGFFAGTRAGRGRRRRLRPRQAYALTRFATNVTVVHRRDRLRASKVMQDRAFANPKIDFAWNTQVPTCSASRP